ncbi:precorrin-6y C5,15-methyltransferase (decarboxylating) subunit CbiE [Butyrivibrio sp. MC2013]|uniref:precorrin-6y C5,15-methyltransferase (decarboxylating) subunit CbiE n=1 Tax=Butyrivibrio sp. MC2013 TaxID=1280686 RepID=UPI0003FD839B|nr:precorrin-6y C5,15-methyltransferase (decarboxylating) subunit CbiE [Butyrivibrio sp. MC2013]
MKIRIYLIGCGSGLNTYVTEGAMQIIRTADLVIGSSRLIEEMGSEVHGRMLTMIRTDEIAEEIESFNNRESRDKTAAVLFSGDTGFFSGATALSIRLGKKNIPFEIIPGISSMQMLATRLKEDYHDWNIVSLHGRTESEEELRNAVIRAVMTGKKTFFLTGGRADPGSVCRVLDYLGLGRLKVIVGEKLFSVSERVTEGSAGQLSGRRFESPAVIITDSVDIMPYRSQGFLDDDFIRGDVPMTKQLVRAMVMSELAVSDGDIVWDVGAGTGSVSIECALISRNGLVYAIEKNRAAVDLIRRNREKFACYNLLTVAGEAPEALSGLPRPDKVFIGGSGGNLEAVIGSVYSANPDAGLVITAITIETYDLARKILEAQGRDYSVSQISVTQSDRLGSYHIMKAANPIMIISSRNREIR